MNFIKLLLISLLLSITAYASEQTPTKQEVAKLYVATFNRAPDNGGLNYWINDSGLKLSQIAQSFFDQDETKILYPDGTSNADFITSVYANLFNRTPDIKGLNYWEGELNAGNISKSRFIEAVINGAQNTATSNDVDILINKTTVGIAFADAGLDDSEQAKTVMNGVTADLSTVNFIKEKINTGNISGDIWSGLVSGSFIVKAGEAITCLGTKSFEVIPTNNPLVTFSTDVDSGDTHIVVDSNSIGFVQVINCSTLQ